MKPNSPELNRPPETYTVKWFIRFFTAIPGKRWTTGDLTDSHGAHCALGHLGVRDIEGEETFTPAAVALGNIFGGIQDVAEVNDQISNRSVESTPKRRILDVLHRKLREGAALKKA